MVYSQSDTTFQLPLKWGIHLGGTYSAQSYSFTSLQFTDYRRDVAFAYAGADYRFRLSKNIYLSLGAEFIKRGYQQNVIINDENVNTEIKIVNKYNIYYLDIPILIQRRLWRNIYCNIGMSPCFMMYNAGIWGYGRTGSYVPIPYKEKTSHYLDNDVNYVDFAIEVGLTGKIYKKLFFEMNAKRGLVNVNRFWLSELGYQNLVQVGLRYAISK